MWEDKGQICFHWHRQNRLKLTLGVATALATDTEVSILSNTTYNKVPERPKGEGKYNNLGFVLFAGLLVCWL
jgi:hypothetical protein